MTRVITDAQLAEDLARNGASGLEAVYTAYAAKLYTYALTMLRDPATAQDVVHDALLVAAGSIGQLRDPLRLRPWLYAITRNECLRTLRGRARFSDADETIDMADTTVDFDAGLRQAEAARLIAQAMAAMSPADRDIVALALQHDLDVERISQVTGSTANTVHARLSRARAGLSDAVSALALYRSKSRCESLRAIISPSDQPLTPLLRKRIQRHVKSCGDCEKRRRAALAAIGPAMAAPLVLSPPDTLPGRILAGLQRGQVQPLTQRAAPFDADGFPVPLDAPSRVKWLVPAAAASIALLVIGVMAWLLVGGSDPVPTSQDSAITTSASPPAVDSASPALPSATAASETSTAQPSDAEQDPADRTPSTPSKRPTPTPTESPTKSPKPTPEPTTAPTKSPKPTKSPRPSQSPTSDPPATQQPTTAPEPEPPAITSVSLTDEDRADDGSFTRCDAFTLRIEATVTGSADTAEAVIAPLGATAPLTGDPLQARITLPPGEYTVTLKATGPAGTATRDAGTVLHICPG